MKLRSCYNKDQKKWTEFSTAVFHKLALLLETERCHEKNTWRLVIFYSSHDGNNTRAISSLKSHHSFNWKRLNKVSEGILLSMGYFKSPDATNVPEMKELCQKKQLKPEHVQYCRLWKPIYLKSQTWVAKIKGICRNALLNSKQKPVLYHSWAITQAAGLPRFLSETIKMIHTLLITLRQMAHCWFGDGRAFLNVLNLAEQEDLVGDWMLCFSCSLSVPVFDNICKADEHRGEKGTRSPAALSKKQLVPV